MKLPTCVFSSTAAVVSTKPPRSMFLDTNVFLSWILVGVFILTILPTSSQAAEEGSSKKLAQQLQKLTNPILPASGDEGKAIRRMLYEDGRERLTQANRRETVAWREVRGRADWEKFLAPRLSALRKSLGNFPPVPKDLHITITKRIAGNGYRIHNLVYSSRPGLWVTANLYLPAKPAKSMPGILLVHSHHRPKEQGELQDMGMLWARRGCAVLVMDQIGHGERRQHPFTSAKSFPKEFRVSRQDYYFRYDTGLQLYLIGDSLMSWMVWDLMRGVDVLLTLPNIDKQRVVLMGAVAGGGDPCAVTAALDKRIAVAVPFNFGGPQPETRLPLPKDAEDRFNYAGSGSWESTRNLYLSARDGFMPWVIVGSVAPRKLIYGHEFAWDKKNDPVWRRLQTIYGWYKQPAFLSSVHGRGSVRGRPLEATHCTNIGAVHRSRIYPSFQKWLDIPIPKSESRERRETKELLCLTPKWQGKNKKVHQLAKVIAERQLAHARKQLEGLSPKQQREVLRKTWSRLLGGIKRIAVNVSESKTIANVSFIEQRVVLHTEGQIKVPLLLLKPKGKTKSAFPVVVGIAQQGRVGFLKHRADTIADLLKNNVAVCLPDPRGTGETAPSDERSWQGWITSISATELMLGRTIRGGQCRDMQTVLTWLRAQPGLNQDRLALWGDSFAPVNAPKRTFVVPRRIGAFPTSAEPMGADVVLLTALFDDNVRAVSIRGGLTSRLSILDMPFCYVPHDAVIPSVFSAGDVGDLVGALAPLAVRVEDMADGQNRRVDTGLLRKKFAPAVEQYRRAQRREGITIAPRGNRCSWFVQMLKK